MSVFVFSAITFSACAVLFEDVFGEIFLFMRERERERVREYDLYIRVYAEIVWCRFVT